MSLLQASSPATVTDYPKSQEPAWDKWLIPGWYYTVVTTTVANVGNIYYIPIFVSATKTYTRICCNVTTGAAGNADLRIFAWNNGVPGALILSAGTVDTAAAAHKEIVINITLKRGYYYLAIRCTAAPTLAGPDKASAVVPPVPGQGRVAIVEYPSKYVIPRSNAAYADPAPAPDSMAEANYAFVYLKSA